MYNNRNEFLNLINEMNLKIGCEIGVYKADYSLQILEKTNLDKLYLIDPWRHLDNYKDISNHNDDDFEKIFLDVYKKTDKFNDRVKIIRDSAENFNSNFSDSFFDFLYLDANHSYEESKKDIYMWYDKVRPGGVFSGHDYLNGSLPQGEFGVKQAIDEFVQEKNLKLQITGESEWKSWFIVKPVNIVMYCTGHYLQNSLNLIEKMNEYNENLIFYLYTLNFDYVSDIENLKVIKITDERIKTEKISFIYNYNNIKDINVLLTVLFKSQIIFDSIYNLGLSEAIYLDSDILPTGDITPIFKYFKEITNYPLIQDGQFHFVIKDGKGSPMTDDGFQEDLVIEYPLMKKLNVPFVNRVKYSNAAVMFYNKNCKDFISEYNSINKECYNLTYHEIQHIYPITDETTLNVLLWKYGYNNRIHFMMSQISNINDVINYYGKDYNNKMIFFHNVKLDLSNEILNYKMFELSINFDENRIYLITDIDFDRNLNINFYGDGKQLISTTSNIVKDILYWYEPSGDIKENDYINVKIYDNEKLIFVKNIKN